MTASRLRASQKEHGRFRSRRRRTLESLESRRLLASLAGEVWLDADGDGSRGPTESAAADVRVYLDANDNATFDFGEVQTQTNALGRYSFNSVPAGDYVVRIAPDTGVQSSPREYVGSGSPIVGGGPGADPTQLYRMSETGEVRVIGQPTTDRIQGLVQTNDGTLVGVNEVTDTLYTIDPLTGQESVLAQAAVNLVAGLAYDPGAEIIYVVSEENGSFELKTVDSVTGQLGDPNESSGAPTDLIASNFGSTYFDFDLVTETAVARPRQFLANAGTALDYRSDGVLFGVFGNELQRYDFPSAGSTSTDIATLSQPIEDISFGATDQLFGVSNNPSAMHTIDLATGVVGAGLPITFGGTSISGLQGFDIAPDGTHYLVDATHLYTFDPATGIATQAPNRGITGLIFTSLSAGADGSLFATLFSSLTPVAQIDPITGLATPLGNNPDGAPYKAVAVDNSVFVTGSALTGLGAVSDLTFDPVGQRIVGFDNVNDRFFQFTTDGVGSLLAFTPRSLNSDSLAFNGTSFVMFDQDDDPNFTTTITVNPDTGAIGAGPLTASQSIPSEALFYATRGDVAQRVTVADTGVAFGLNFGVLEPSGGPSLPLASIEGTIYFDIDGNGNRGILEQSLANVTVYLDANDNGLFDDGEVFTTTNSFGQYKFEQLSAGTYIVRQVIPTGFLQSTPQAYFGTAYETGSGQTQLFEMDKTGTVRRIGQPTAKPIYGLIQTNEGRFFGSNFVNDTIYMLDPATGLETLLSRPPATELTAGLAYDSTTDTIYTVGKVLLLDPIDPSAGLNRLNRLLIIDPDTGEVTPIGPGLDELGNVSDLTFDTVNRRLVGFDNNSDRFFAFDVDGNGTHLARANRSLNSFSLAFNGSTFVMLDQDDLDRERAITVNPDTGTTGPAFTASEPIPSEALTFAGRSNVAARITVSDTSIATSIDFGLTSGLVGLTAIQSDDETRVDRDNRTDEIDVVLNSPPKSDVVVSLTVDPTILSSSARTLVFTPDNWQTPQRFTVTLLDGAAIGDTQVVLAVDQALSDDAWSIAAPVVVPVVVREAADIGISDSTFINEVLVDPFLGSTRTGQFVELRGAKGGRLNSNTYFVIVDEDTFSEGEIHGIFDLSNQPLGENGFLVLLEQNSPHVPVEGAAVLQSTLPGFGGLPGDIYTDSHPLSDSIDFIVGSNTYMLIESTVPPQLGDDIDVDDDGFVDPDGVISNWKVLDSISMHPFVGGSDTAYGNIVFAEQGTGTPVVNRPPGVELIISGGGGYAGRVGDSVGYAAEDWVFGNVRPSGAGGIHRLEPGFFGPSEPVPYQGYLLDHVGDSNFVGGVRGVVLDAPATGQGPSRGAVPATGITVFADTNGNETLDSLTHVVDPDDVVPPFDPLNPGFNPRISVPLLNAYPGLTVSSFSLGSIFDDNVTSENQRAFPTVLTNRIFAQGGIDWFSSSDVLRFDFLEPVSAVSIDAIGNDSPLGITYGRLDAYNDNDQLIGFVRSDQLVNSARQTISVSFPDDQIAYVFAYSDNGFNGGGPFGRFDRMVYTQLEPHAVTDEDGIYEIRNLVPGRYDILVETAGNPDSFVGAEARHVEVIKYENFEFIDEVRANSAPETDPAVRIVLDENFPIDTPFGSVPGSDADGQTVTFSLVDSTRTDIVVDPLTGELSFSEDAVRDFETNPELVFDVRVTDSLGASATSTVTVVFNDVNEPPTVVEELFNIAEGTEAGTSIGQINAIDPDTELSQTLTFTVLRGTGKDIFDVGLNNGLVTVADPTKIDFEDQTELILTILVSDGVDSTEFDQRIRVVDQNDRPELTTVSLTVAENSRGVVGQLLVFDPDVTDTHRFELIDGTGKDIFSVSPTGAVSVRPDASIDAETNDNYTLEVFVVDNGAPRLSATGTVTVNIEDVNESPILDVESVTLPENSPTGDLVSVISAIDPEGAEDDYEITLVDDAEAANFDFDSATGELRVAANANLDFEAAPIRQLQFEITDTTGASPTVRVTLAVFLTDQNDAPRVTTERFVVSESAQAGSAVAVIRVQDADTGDQVRVDIVGGNALALFRIDPETRILFVKEDVVLDAETQTAPLELEVKATDSAGAFSSRVIEVVVNDVNEPPAFGTTLSPPTAFSGRPFEFQVPEDFIVDPEGGEFSVTAFGPSGTLPAWLSFNGSTRTFSGLPNPMFEGSYPLTLRAFEAGSLELFSNFFFSIDVEAGDTPLTYERDPLDVNANNEVTSSDALNVINFISRHGAGASVDTLVRFNGFVDVNGDRIVTAVDALRVINGLAILSRSGEAESISASGVLEDRDEANDAALEGYLRESLLF